MNYVRLFCSLGRELVGLHLLEAPGVYRPITRYPISNKDTLEARLSQMFWARSAGAGEQR